MRGRIHSIHPGTRVQDVIIVRLPYAVAVVVRHIRHDYLRQTMHAYDKPAAVKASHARQRHRLTVKTDFCFLNFSFVTFVKYLFKDILESVVVLFGKWCLWLRTKDPALYQRIVVKLLFRAF